MAVTSNWEWVSVNRNKDYTIISGQNVFRENWSLTRKRISNEAYTSELGTSITSLSAYNGGVTETISCPTYSAYSFGTTQTWVDSGVLWVPTGFTRGGVASYRCVEPAKQNTEYINVIFKGTRSGTASYIIGAVTSGELSAGNWPNDSNSYGSPRHVNYKNEAYTTLTGDYSPSYSSTASESRLSATSTNASFYCTSDVQTYDSAGVDWFTQTQTWQSKTPWA